MDRLFKPIEDALAFWQRAGMRGGKFLEYWVALGLIASALIGAFNVEPQALPLMIRQALKGAVFGAAAFAVATVPLVIAIAIYSVIANYFGRRADKP